MRIPTGTRQSAASSPPKSKSPFCNRKYHQRGGIGRQVECTVFPFGIYIYMYIYILIISIFMAT